MSFNGTEGGQITIQAAAPLTARYRGNFPSNVKARFFGRDILLSILAQQDCQGIRMYFAQEENGNMQLVICGADSNQNDMLDLIGDMSLPCPTSCSTKNSLNC